MLRLPDALRNPVSLIGMAVATAAAAVFLVLLVLELAGYLTNPYLGLLLFVSLPLVFVGGLLLIPAGAWWAARRRAQGRAPAEWPVLDLRDGRQRTILVLVFVLTIVNVVIVSIGAYGGVHYMESAAFCGQVCHTTMEPQAVAHQDWPHARVACTQCHIGPGAGAFVEAKLAGARQLMHVATGRVPKPVPPPQRLIQSSTIACQQCHSPETVYGDRLRVIRDYVSDEANTENVTTLRLHVGDRFSGIHRHIGLAIEYAGGEPGAATIPFVRVRTPQGTVREYVAEGAAAPRPAADTLRTMECTDCHNRPAHTFFASAERGVDAAIARGRVPRVLPFARREAVAALAGEYDSADAARDGIARRLTSFYASRGDVDQGQVRQAVSAVQRLWARNVFPRMKVTWGTYPSHLGHVDAPGCFRCHDDGHKAGDGAVLSQDCELCHTLPE